MVVYSCIICIHILVDDTCNIVIFNTPKSKVINEKENTKDCTK